MIVPTAVIAASMDPQKAAKKPIAITIATPNPPGQWPTRVVVNLTNLDAAPPFNIAIPVKINKGTAISTCLVNAPNETCIKTDQGKFNPAIAAKELPRPKTKKNGTEMTNVTREIIKANPNIYSFPKSFFRLSKISSNEVNARIKKPTGKAKNIHQIGILISNSIICPKL